MKAILLAAGRGSRLQGLTDYRPKCLVEFNGRPLLEHTIQSLRDGGVTEIGIVSGYRREMVAEYADTLFANERWDCTGIFHSLTQADAWLKQETCIVSYSDIFYSPDMVVRLIQADGDIVVAYDPDAVTLWQRRFEDPLADLERFVLGDGQRIDIIGGRPTSMEQVQGQYMGLLRLTPRGWHALRAQQQRLDTAERDNIDMTSLLAKVMQDGIPLQGVASHEPWGEIDCPSDIELYESIYPHLYK